MDFEFNRCVQNPSTFNFGTEKSRTVLPDDVSTESSSQVQIVIPAAAASPQNRQRTKALVPSKLHPKNESVIVSMSDVVKSSPSVQKVRC